MKKSTSIGFIFYIYYALILIVAVVDIIRTSDISNTIYFGLVSAFIGIITQMFYGDYKKQRTAIEASMENIPKIETFHEEEFYSRFRYYIRNVQHNCDITHLGCESPQLNNRPEQNDYYNSLIKLVKSRPEVMFRRVERVSEKKIEWIEQLLLELDGQSNFSLYCFVDDSKAARHRDMPDMLSVQIIDDTHLFIIALLEQASTVGVRDIYIRDQKLVNFFKGYYNTRLIARSKPIIDRGLSHPDTWKKIKSKLT